MFEPVCEHCYCDLPKDKETIKDEEDNLFCSEECKAAFRKHYEGIGDFDEAEIDPNTI